MDSRMAPPHLTLLGYFSRPDTCPERTGRVDDLYSHAVYQRRCDTKPDQICKQEPGAMKRRLNRHSGDWSKGLNRNSGDWSKGLNRNSGDWSKGLNRNSGDWSKGLNRNSGDWSKGPNRNSGDWSKGLNKEWFRFRQTDTNEIGRKLLVDPHGHGCTNWNFLEERILTILYQQNMVSGAAEFLRTMFGRQITDAGVRRKLYSMRHAKGTSKRYQRHQLAMIIPKDSDEVRELLRLYKDNQRVTSQNDCDKLFARFEEYIIKYSDDAAQAANLAESIVMLSNLLNL